MGGPLLVGCLGWSRVWGRCGWIVRVNVCWW